AEVIQRAKQGKPGDKPLVIADYTDNPGGGGYGDSTAVLKAMVEAGLKGVGFHAICDPEAVMAGQAAGVRRTATIRLGGKADPAKKQTVFVKSMHHFRAAFQPLAREVVLVDSRSLCSENYKPGVYKKIRHPIWPIDQMAVD